MGIAASNLLTRRILSAGPFKVGVGGGRTVGRMIDSLRNLSKSDFLAVSLIGASSRNDGTSAYSLTLRMAAAVGGGAPARCPRPLSSVRR